MSDKQKPFTITRRKALAGLSTVGLASAGAGLGTSAFLTDEESFENNQLTVGEVDLSITGELIFDNRPSDVSGGSSAVTVDDSGSSTFFISIEDAKPGDRYVFRTDYTLSGNPAFLKIDTDRTGDEENASNNPSGVSGLDASDGDGELDDNTAVALFYGGNTVGDGALLGGGDGTGLSLSAFDSAEGNSPGTTETVFELGTTRNNSDITKLNGRPTLAAVLTEDINENGSYGDSSPSGITNFVVHNQDIPDVDTTAAVAGTGGSDPAALPSGNTYRFFWDLQIPSSVENEIQADSVSFELGGTVEQVRNNATPFTN